MATVLKKRSGTILLLAGALFLAGCSPQGRTDEMEEPPYNVPPEATVSDLDIERAEVESDLVTMRDRIDARIEEVDTRLGDQDLTTGQRADLTRYREELQDRRTQIQRARRDVDASRPEAWDNVRTSTNNTLDDIEDWFDQQGDRISRIFSDEDGSNDEPEDIDINGDPVDEGTEP